MARTITKGIASATIYALDPTKKFDVDENGMPKANVVFATDGNPTSNKARLLAEKFCKSRNVMVLDVVVDETKLNVAPDVFYSNSAICLNGNTYGREYVTQTFKTTWIWGFAMGENGMESIEDCYMGVTTESKLLNYVRKNAGTQNCIITRTEIREQRRYMTRDKFMELAR